MKKLTLLTAVAWSCCVVSPAFAQIQILRGGSPVPAPQLIGDQSPASDSRSDQPGKTSQDLPNPFDYFDQGLIEDAAGATVHEAQADAFRPADAANQPSSPPPAEASSPRPIARQSTPAGPSVVDSILAQDVVSSLPNASVTPAFWGGAPQTPNPVAQWLLRQDCVDGLWANYPQQRAAECAHMWNHIHGHHACGCAAAACAGGVCAGSGCSTVSGPCSVCSGHGAPAPRNRYLEHLRPHHLRPQAAQLQPPAACDGCQAHLASGTGLAPSPLPPTVPAAATAQAAEDQPAQPKSAARQSTLSWFR